jgi:hypothetical protein
MPHGHRRERAIIRAALFTALSVALGFLLAAIPNVELMTLTVFMSGVFCGARLGGVVGTLSIFFYSILNPLGPAPPPLLASQVAGFCIIGFAGGLAAPRIKPGRSRVIVASAVIGFALTLLYDILTTLATAFIALGAGAFIGGVGGIFVAGVGFVAWHVGVNTAIFAVVVTPLMKAVYAWQGGEAA